MRKLLTFILTLAMICSLAVPAMAANEAVVYTSDSSFVAGGTVKVNEQKTKQNIMDLGKNAAEYNAALKVICSIIGSATILTMRTAQPLP